MQKKLLLYFAFTLVTSFIFAQSQISNKALISLELSSAFDGNLYGGGIKIDRKITTNLSLGIHASYFYEYTPSIYVVGGEISPISDNGNEVIYNYNQNDSLNSYLNLTDFWGFGNVQIGLNAKYSLFTNKATKPYVGINLSYNKQINDGAAVNLGESKSILLNRLEDNTGLITSLEFGLNHNFNNRFGFFFNVRTTLFTKLTRSNIDREFITREYDEYDNIVKATFREEVFETKYAQFIGSAGFSYKIY